MDLSKVFRTSGEFTPWQLTQPSIFSQLQLSINSLNIKPALSFHFKIYYVTSDKVLVVLCNKILHLPKSWGWESQYRRFLVSFLEGYPHFTEISSSYTLQVPLYIQPLLVWEPPAPLTQHTVCHQATRQVCAILYCSLSWHFYHQCNLCDFKCSTEHNLKTHIRLKHHQCEEWSEEIHDKSNRTMMIAMNVNSHH